MTARAFAATIFAVLLVVPSALPAHAAKQAPLLPGVQPNDDPSTAIVLCYHIVESPQDPRMEISREAFLQQMSYLALTGYNVIPLRDLYDYVTGKKATIPKNAVVITIDDGWRSTYTEVFPEMKRRHFPFTVFVYPRIIGQTSHAMTWKQVRELSEAGVDIQSHSLSHPFLTHRRHAALDDKTYAEWLQRELVESQRILERETGKGVEFIAYPYGDFDHNVVKTAVKAGYLAGLTCEYGPVRRGSDPLRMRRVAIDKRMDFAAYRHFLGAGQMQLADMTPHPGQTLDTQTAITGVDANPAAAAVPSPVIISAKIPGYKRLDPKSVRMTLITATGSDPFSYDPRDGSISLTVKEALNGKFQRALVWANDVKSGKRVEGMWSFRLTDSRFPVVDLTCPPKDIVPATPPTQLAVPLVATPPANGGAAAPAVAPGGPHAEAQLPRPTARPH
jgi:peptidoglycan/xylan/chitin deacetylase (PgdA/CDA1 family)